MKTKYLMILVSAALLVSGCIKEKSELPGRTTLKARLEATGTRVSIGNVDGKLTWNEGDEIAVHVGNAYQNVTVDPASEQLSVAESESSYRNYYAVYPASVAVAGDYGNPDLKVTLPDSYDISDIVDGTSTTTTAEFAPLPMVADNDRDNSILYFYHVGGLLRVTLNGVKPTTKYVRISFDKDVTGTYTVADPGTDHPTITTAGTETNNAVTFTLTSNTQLGSTLAAGPIVLNVPVPCGSYAWVKVECLNSSNTVIASKTYDEKTRTFQRHHGKRLSESTLTIDYIANDNVDISRTNREVLVDFSKTIYVDVDKLRNSEVEGPAAWQAYFYTSAPANGTALSTDWSPTPLQDGYGNDWLTLSAYEGSGDYNRVDVSLTKIPWTVEVIGQTRAMQMIEEWKNDTGVTDIDLSLYNILTGAQDAVAETANCYVIKKWGSYLIPCVYGNAISGGVVNTGAYTTSSGENKLATFINADGNPIGNAVITSDGNLTKSSNLKARVVWQDVMSGVKTLTDDDLEYVSTPGTAANCPYIRVNVQQNNIKPCNIIIALYDEDNDKILWSWHLWVTRDDFAIVNVLQSDNTTSNSFLNMDLGWTPPLSFAYKYNAREQYVIIVCKENGKVVDTFKVSQGEYSDNYVNKYYSGTYYQWGRKDPFLPDRHSGNRYSSAGDGFAVQPGTDYQKLVSMTLDEAGTDNDTRLGSTVRYPYKLLIQPIEDNVDNNFYYPDYVNLWNVDNTGTSDETVTKTVYDPSPRGFHVPRQNAFTGFTSTGGDTRDFYNRQIATGYGTSQDYSIELELRRGAYLTVSHSSDPATHTIFWGALGLRSGNDGNVVYVNDHCNSWSASPADRGSNSRLVANSLDFNAKYVTSHVWTKKIIPRCYALPVRPVQE